jgi:hypothetical protein
MPPDLFQPEPVGAPQAALPTRKTMAKLLFQWAFDGL